ncbi:MAG: aspartate aminotransferase family protein [Parvibaculaceae bacterium]
MSADTAAKGLGHPNDLESNWLPFTPNRQFKREPRLLSRAKDTSYFKPDGTEVLDATAGLWCCNAGHCRDEIVKAIQDQAGELDFAPTFQFGHPKAFELASRITSLMPGDLDHVLFCNSGSEAADTALKIAIAYHRANGEGGRTRLIGRERGYHGVGFGGISVGGMVANRKVFGPMLAGVDHLSHTYNRAEQKFTIGQPAWGAHLADDLQRLVELHDASTIAAVIVEPMAGSTGVLPPPVGYLERLREICTKHGILLIFDEVITGYGRLGYATAAERFGVTPDILTFAKGITSGTVPMGGAVVRKHIYDIFQTGPDHLIDLFHGYTYSGHPLAAAAGIATLDLYKRENLFERAREMEPVFAEAIMSLKHHKLVADIRCIGLAGAVDLVPLDGLPGKRGFDAMRAAFHDLNMMVRVSGDTIAFSPPLIISNTEITDIFDRFTKVLDKIAG